MYIMTFFDDLFNFGSKATPPPAYNGPTQTYNPNEGIAPTTKATDPSLTLALKNEFVQPFKREEKRAVSGVDSIENVVKTGFEDVKTGLVDVEQFFVKSERAIVNEFNYFKTDVIKGEKAVERFISNDVVPIGKNLEKVVASGLRGAVFLVEHPVLVVGAVTSYLAIDYLNKLKQLNA